MDDDMSIENVEFRRQDDFMIAHVVYDNGRLGTGVAKRHPADNFDERRARKLAVQRASPVANLCVN
jgi:hypothetical protein